MPALRFHPDRLARLALAAGAAVLAAVPLCRLAGLGASFAVPLALLGVRAAQQRGLWGLGVGAGGAGGAAGGEAAADVGKKGRGKLKARSQKNK